MSALKSGLAALVLVAGLSSSARAQKFTAYPGAGVNSGYYTTNGGFGNYGLPGSYPNYGGYGLSGYGPGADLGGYFAPAPNRNAPKTYNNMGGLMNTIKQQTGKPNSYRSGSKSGIPRNGRGL